MEKRSRVYSAKTRLRILGTMPQQNQTLVVALVLLLILLLAVLLVLLLILLVLLVLLLIVFLAHVNSPLTIESFFGGLSAA